MSDTAAGVPPEDRATAAEVLAEVEAGQWRDGTTTTARCTDPACGGWPSCPASQPATAALCEHCGERPRAKTKLGRHEHLSRFCSELCALAHPAVPDDLDALRRRFHDAG